MSKALVLAAIGDLEKVASCIEEQGASSRWVGSRDGKPYLYWMHDGRERCRRITEDEAVEHRRAYDNYLLLRWLQSGITHMREAVPKRLAA